MAQSDIDKEAGSARPRSRCAPPRPTNRTSAGGPVGRARRAYAAGDLLLLNAIAREGWDLVTAAFVYHPTGSQSRDKLFTSGQEAILDGKTSGVYLFRRAVPAT